MTVMLPPRGHPIAWQAPRPLWHGATPFAAAPQILRFASDDFMEQMLATLAENPAQISTRVARPETWRSPAGKFESADLIQRVPIPAPVAASKRRRLFRGTRPVPPPAAIPAQDEPLKLYQPAHQRHYLVTGSLVCAIPGLPERKVAGGHETVHFVMRRLLPKEKNGDPPLHEYAFVKDGNDARWQLVDADAENPDRLAPGEDLLPLFPLTHDDANSSSRTLWAGLVPVARRDDYLSKAVDRTAVALVDGQLAALRPGEAPKPRESKLGRMTLFKMDVAEPWKAIVRAAQKASSDLTHGDPDNKELDLDKKRRRLDYNLQFQMQSWLVLLDLADWLKDHLKEVWTAVMKDDPSKLTDYPLAVYDWLNKPYAWENNQPAENPLVNSLNGTISEFRAIANMIHDKRLPPEIKLSTSLRSMMNSVIDAMNAQAKNAPPTSKLMVGSLREALKQICDETTRNALEAQTKQYTFVAAVAEEPGWPPFHFPLAGLNDVSRLRGPFEAAPAAVPAPEKPEEEDADKKLPIIMPPAAMPADEAEILDKVTALVVRALPEKIESDIPPIPFAMKLRDTIVATANDQGLFVIRMVHINRDCGPLHPPTLSAASERFHLASYFDSDAPVRPIRITLPADTSPAGLRKHGRGTAFVLSDILCGQVQRAKALGLIDLICQVLPWPFHKDIDLGDGGPCRDSKNDVGMICSLSIPIVTLCALILLMIIISLLDFIFRWLPWFIACFPVRGLKGKQR